MLTGLSAGLFAGLLGIGGGVLFVPLLMSIFPHIGIHSAIATSCGFTALTGTGAFFSHTDKYPPMKKELAYILSGSIFGTIIGPQIALRIPESPLAMCFVLVLAFPYIMRHIRINFAPSPTTFFSLGIFTGTAATIFGIGGGVFVLPFLIQVFKKDVRSSITTSSLFIAINSTFGTLVYAVSGMVAWNILLIAGPAGIIGASIGAKISHQMSPRMLKIIMLAIVVFIIVKMVSIGIAR